uniref:HIRAN domain-containing protein n=1 Tax=Prevotella sp. GTC17262 TaxID=3236797 RepID=A0AB33JED0_9BACT
MKVLRTIGIWVALCMAVSIILTLFSYLVGSPEELPPSVCFLFGVMILAGPIMGTVYINRRIAQREEDDEEDDNRVSSCINNDSVLFQNNIHSIEFEVAGLTHRSQKAINRAEELADGETVYLIKDPTNPYDENAIKIMTDDDIHIGYVPRFLCTEVAELMDGDTGIAYVDYINYGKYCPFVHLYM